MSELYQIAERIAQRLWSNRHIDRSDNLKDITDSIYYQLQEEFDEKLV